MNGDLLTAAAPMTSTTGWLLVVGIGLVLSALGWRLIRLQRVRLGVRAGLRDDDPGVRVAAVRQAAELGLATSAPALLRAVHEEKDVRVLAAVVETVASRQWEPASTGRLVQLRLWAKAFADAHPELRGSDVSAPPLLPGVVGAVTPPSLDPTRVGTLQRAVDTAPSAADAAVPAQVVPDHDAIASVRVLVTGAGGPAGVAVIRSLRRHGHHVIAVDADPLAVGLLLADEHHVVPRFADPSYVAALLRAATVGNAQALICTVAEEYDALLGAADYLDEAGVRALMPSAEAVRSCVDKWQFAERLADAGLPTPATNLGSAENVPGPWVVKPRYGRGSRDVHLCSTRTQLAHALRATPDPIVQTQVTGREFTCDALVDSSGALAGAAPRWRLETKAGISTKGMTFEDPEVVNVAALVLKAVGLVGPANVQGFVTDDGAVLVHEVNPRFSGGLPLSLHAGADLVGEYLRAVMGHAIRPDRLVARPGVTMMRYFDEVFAQ